MRVSGPTKNISESEEQERRCLDKRISGVLFFFSFFSRQCQSAPRFQVLTSVAWQWQTQCKTSHLHVITKRCARWQRPVLYLTTHFNAAFCFSFCFVFLTAAGGVSAKCGKQRAPPCTGSAGAKAGAQPLVPSIGRKFLLNWKGDKCISPHFSFPCSDSLKCPPVCKQSIALFSNSAL